MSFDSDIRSSAHRDASVGGGEGRRIVHGLLASGVLLSLRLGYRLLSGTVR